MIGGMVIILVNIQVVLLPNLANNNNQFSHFVLNHGLINGCTSICTVAKI